ncbi:MAG: GNAT family N-acetyltransferase [Pseudomonadota bacterium]|nr:GNAT family N-acetyltransferase [Pseudomonadota bacterium]
MPVIAPLTTNPGPAPHFPAIAGDHWIEPLDDGRHVLIRPLRPNDRSLESAFIKGLSPRSLRNRFMEEFREPSKDLLDQLMATDGKDSLALIALVHDDGALTEVGIARYSSIGLAGQCECAVTVADDWQHLGLGSRLMRHLIDQARQHRFRRMVSFDAASNESMRELARYLGFHRAADPGDPTQVIHSYDL